MDCGFRISSVKYERKMLSCQLSDIEENEKSLSINPQSTTCNPQSRGKMAFAEIAPGVVGRAKGGDEEAFHLIFNRYGRPVLSFINNHVRNRDLAEELAQETFVRAYKNLGGLKDEMR